MTQSTQLYYPRQLMAPIIFIWLFIILIYFFSTNSLLSQLQQPVLISPQSDNSFWLLHILRLPQWILEHRGMALAFDIILTSSCIICIFVPDQRIFTWITVIGTWLLYVCYCTAAGKHYAQIGYLVVPISFLALKKEKFSLLWEGIRYWICFLYTCAGLYKLYYGGFAYSLNMSHILQQMNAEWLFFNPTGIQATIIHYLADHQGISQWLYRMAAMIELSLIIGFFTNKFDRLLIIGLFVFHLGNFLLLHIPFVEQSLIFAPFFPWKKWAVNFHTTNGND
ncbi:hypothetical protein BH11BAC3_BH11BAC3_17680 [soil metagenome]